MTSQNNLTPLVLGGTAYHIGAGGSGGIWPPPSRAGGGGQYAEPPGGGGMPRVKLGAITNLSINQGNTMRSVTYQHRQQPILVNGLWEAQPSQTIVAKFHQWAIDADGQVAILEHPNGSIKIVAAELVTFINPQSSV